METTKLASTKRFGPRYGRSLKERLAKIEVEYNKPLKCPYCGKNKVKRVAIGIWFCKKCNNKFTGKAYSIFKKIVTKEQTKEPEEEVKEAEEETSEEEENLKQ
jgi:large subunit ribosomal protein L37Ae